LRVENYSAGWEEGGRLSVYRRCLKTWIFLLPGEGRREGGRKKEGGRNSAAKALSSERQKKFGRAQRNTRSQGD